ncbi:bestrophin family ion channel [Pantoea sp. LMR881]|uniref:bestrophin family protein n=1 Tax=Pantoea sp. LMR881 TaxID=3014336 RepID=UPI0022AF80E5|nr:bestrophin family ion channel [Pantoea sp. LMR881]MCZ4058385.1 bestrophin family ion channel [Pantoea sp. LMR881]
MIVRPSQHWFRRLFDWHGSVLSKILFRLSLNLLMSVIAILSYQWYESLGIHLTTAPFSLLGVAIAIFLGFRNNASYARFTEARVLWGSLLITQRSLLRQIKSSLLSDEAAAKEFAAIMTAFSWSLKHQLRQTDARADLQRLLPTHWHDQVLDNPMPASQLLLCMGIWSGEQREKGAISDIVWQSIDKNFNQLSHVLGGCERIASTPIPFAYSLMLHRTVYLFCTLLPFALVKDLHFMTPLVSVFVSYTFLSLESLAEELEDPFGMTANDLPLDAICVAIERNLKAMNSDFPLPPALQPDKHFNLT